MRTTHFTGTATDVGLLVGQLYPLQMANPAHWWKLRILSGLLMMWIFAGAVGSIHFSESLMFHSLFFLSSQFTNLIYPVFGDATAYIAAALSLTCGMIGEVSA
jgi:hypothetical protein